MQQEIYIGLFSKIILLQFSYIHISLKKHILDGPLYEKVFDTDFERFLFLSPIDMLSL